MRIFFVLSQEILDASDDCSAFRNIITKGIGLPNILDQTKELFFIMITTIMSLLPVPNLGRLYDWLTIFQVLRIYRVGWAIPFIRNVFSFYSEFFGMFF
jgi:hypothetical protein